jgi:RsiW-degrading membrane proteinase PrsW (M82 family)
VLKTLIGLLPVLAFLGALLYMESYKLVRLHFTIRVLLGGAFTAVLAYFANGYAIEALNMGFIDYTHFVSPIIEESLKGLVVVYLFRSNRIGFLVDAAILGFAVGAGFAMAENMYYLYHAADAQIAIWVVRGFGTAVMHGGVTAIFAVIAQVLTERQTRTGLLWFIPGLLVAAILHSIFNQFPISPILSTIATLIFIPLILMLVFRKSIAVMHEWLEVDFDVNKELLETIRAGEFTQSKAGRIKKQKPEMFDGLIVADMLCYIRLYIELAMRAKGMLIAREFEMDIKVDDETKYKFKELRALEKSIGKAGFLAMRPYLDMSRRDLWQLFMLEDQK